MKVIGPDFIEYWEDVSVTEYGGKSRFGIRVQGTAVLASILVVGLIIAMAAFSVLSRRLGKLAGAPLEPDSDEYETDRSLAAALVPNSPNDFSAPRRAWIERY